MTPCLSWARFLWAIYICEKCPCVSDFIIAELFAATCLPKN